MSESESSRPRGLFDPAAVAFDPEVEIALIAEARIRRAIDRGEFDDLPGSGEPLDLSDHHDPDWWLKSLMKRERIVMLPPSIELRRDDAELDDRLDRFANESTVRDEVEQFNARVLRARYHPPAGPPLVTVPRDVEATVSAWAERRASRAAAALRAAEEEAARERAAKARRGVRGWIRRARERGSRS